MNLAAEGETAPNQRDQRNRSKLRIHGLGIARLREIGKRGFGVAASRQSAALFSFFRRRLSAESRYVFRFAIYASGDKILVNRKSPIIIRKCFVPALTCMKAK
jgi:hypothetical protein